MHIGVISPSSAIAAMCPRRTQRGIEAMERRGHKVTVATHALVQGEFTAGTPEQRAEDLHEMFANPDIDFILATIGGYNANDLLDLLDYERIAQHPKPLMGYSDITVLLFALHERAGIQTILGPALLPQFGESPDVLAFTDEAFSHVLSKLGTGATYDIPVAPQWTEEFLPWDKEDDRARSMTRNPGWSILRSGQASGRLLGGNVSTCTLLLGTPYQPSTQDAILFLEDESGVSPAILQRHLQQLSQGGFFENIRGVVFGRFQSGSQMEDGVLSDICEEIFEDARIPIIAGVDFGHTDPMLTLPFGKPVEIRTEDMRIRLTL